VPIRSAELRKDWPWVKPLVEAVIAKTNEPWWPEDVYASVVAGRAAMWVNDEPEGVLVAYPEAEAWTGDKVLHVWVCHCVGGMEQLNDEIMAILEAARQRIGAKSIVMDSPRPGWQKAGWRVKRYIYER
jgi:hypothetical protein